MAEDLLPVARTYGTAPQPFHQRESELKRYEGMDDTQK